MEMNQLDSDLHLPPRKRLLAGYKKLNSYGSSSSSSSSASNSNGSSSASTDVQTHLNSDQNQSPEELVEAARSAATLAVKAAKAARTLANEKALISSKAIAAAKRALELVDSFPKEADCKDRSPKKNKKKKHVPVDYLSPMTDEEDAVARMERAIDRRYIQFLKFRLDFAENGQINKKQKMNKTGVTGYMNGISGVVDSDSSYDGSESNRKVSEVFKPDEVDSIPTPWKEEGEEQGNSLGRRRGRGKVKKLPLSVCNSRDQENGISVAQPAEDGVIPVIPGSSSRKCLDLKAPESVKQNKAVRS